MKDIDAMISEVIAELEKMADPERREWARGNYPTTLKIIGVKVPDERKITNALIKDFKKLEAEKVLEIAKKLVNTGILECQHIAYEALSKHKKALQLLNLKHLTDLGKGLDNWLSVDSFGVYLAGYAWRQGQITDDVVLQWAESDDRWWRRTAVVCTVALNQKAHGGTGDPVRTLVVCRKVASDNDPMVAKALSWTLRELVKIEPEPVKNFLNEHEAVLPPRVKREVKSKLETGKKN
jgi:3-methyladenine DNA glycosylase AlkD